MVLRACYPERAAPDTYGRSRPGRQREVLIVINSLTKEHGGPTRCATNAAIAHHQHKAARVTIAYATSAGHDDAEAITALTSAGVATVAFNSRKSPPTALQYWALSFAGPRWLIRNVRRFDVIQLHGAWHWLTLCAALAAAGARIPTILVPHETLTQFDLATSRNFILRLGKRGLVKLYRRLISHTTFSSQLEADDSYEVSPWTVVPHPVIPEASARPARSGPTIYGYVGRFHPKKRVAMLVKAFAGVSDPRTTLELVGDGPERAEIRRYVNELELSGRVNWHGLIDYDGVQAFLARIDVLVMPSAYECFGMSAAEALSVGCPAIVTRRVGLAALVESFDAGWVTDGNIGALSSALNEATDEEAVSARGSRATAAAKAGLTFDAYIREIDDVYDQVS
jgi:glycosyltransferase involved in cell wall biosynthesis